MSAPADQAPPEELTFEADFTRHIMSLFTSLFDSRACPYMGPIAPSTDAQVAAEPEVPDLPGFDTSLCDFRLKLSYQNEVNDRPAILDQLAAKSDALRANVAKPGAETKVVLGDPLPARTPEGKPADAERQAARLQAAKKCKKAAMYRRTTSLDQRRNAAKTTAGEGRRDWEWLMRQVNEIRQAELEVRKEFAAERKRKMILKRKEMEALRTDEYWKTKGCEATVRNVSYRSPKFDRTGSPITEESPREIGARSRERRLEAGEAAKKHNEETIRATRELKTAAKFSVRL
jgi:hypothetical protein